MSDIPSEGFALEDFHPPTTMTPIKEGTYLEVTSPNEIPKEGFTKEEFHPNVKLTVTSPDQVPEPAAKKTGIARNIAAGGYEGLASIVGAPVDLTAGAINLGITGVNKLAGTKIPVIENPIGGSKSIEHGLEKLGVDISNVTPADESEKLARSGAAAATAAIMPIPVARALAEGNSIAKVFGAAGIPSTAVGGFGAGVSGQYAENRVPEPWKPLANFASQMIAGGALAGASSLSEAGRRQGADWARHYLEPINPLVSVDERTRQMAGKTLNQSGVTALGDLESWNKSQVQVNDFLNTQKAVLDTHLGTAEDTARITAQDQINAIGGHGTPAQYGQDVRESVAKNYEPIFTESDESLAKYKGRTNLTDVEKGQYAKLLIERDALEKSYPIKPGGFDSTVAEQYFRPGSKGGEAFQNYLRDTGGSREDVGNLFDYAMSKLRSFAVKDDGTLNPTKFNQWVKNHQGALADFPSDLKAKFQDAATAQQTLDRQIGIRAQAIRDYQSSAARFYLGGSPDNFHAMQSLLNSKNPQASAQQLVDLVRGDPDALNGLRRDFMEYATSKANTKNTEGAAFLTNLKDFLQKNGKVVETLFDKETVDNLNKISASGGRDVKSTFGNVGHGTGRITFGSIILAELAAAAGEYALHQSLPTAAVAFGATPAVMYLNHLRAVGIEKANQLIAEAATNPEMLRTLSANAPRDLVRSLLKDKFFGQLSNLGTEAAIKSTKQSINQAIH